MLRNMKKSSLMTKLLYLFAFIVFAVWVLPKISAYYNNLNSYKKSLQELKKISTEHDVSTQTQKFSESVFKQKSELLFSKVSLKDLANNKYEVNITMKKEDLQTFHTFIETISLRYYVEIKDSLDFKTEDEVINVRMILKAF
ncbi:MAG: Unknown protein [uncultured Sulfurovum sp.]|uniref:General secretion pathway protein M n=1 Tax=uncultured Sulfurovum sp. TaxID=269237 RepID=A0A6S6UCF0_9BACT|nr:MAG: Unknown protein [uncultured Sulfurovum sp.]